MYLLPGLLKRVDILSARSFGSSVRLQYPPQVGGGTAYF